MKLNFHSWADIGNHFISGATFPPCAVFKSSVPTLAFLFFFFPFFPQSLFNFLEVFNHKSNNFPFAGGHANARQPPAVLSLTDGHHGNKANPPDVAAPDNADDISVDNLEIFIWCSKRLPAFINV